jgi:hypothetical protein
MKIISKYKDYYDFLSGINGIDEKIILDRRNFQLLSPSSRAHKIQIYLCDFLIEGLCYKDRYYFGEQLEIFVTKEMNSFEFRERDSQVTYALKVDGEHFTINKDVAVLREPINSQLGIAILVPDSFGIIKTKERNFVPYPPLESFGLGSIISPEVMWQTMYNWVAKQNDKNISEPDNKTKILSHGFDLKTSFRNPIK